MLALRWPLVAIAFLAATPQDAKDPEAEFQALLAKAKEAPTKTDFKALRLAFTRTAAYQPYSKGEFDPGPVIQELKNGERDAARVALDRAMAGFWVNPKAHAFAASACEQIGEDERAALHEAFMEGLLDTILGAGDGHGFETAWPVIEVREEYMVLEAYDLDRQHTQSLVEHDGHHFDLHTFKDEGTGKEFSVYFNIDVPYGWLQQHVESLMKAREAEAKP